VANRCDPTPNPIAYILSARFGLIPGKQPIPRYERSLRPGDYLRLKGHVEKRLDQVLDELQPSRLFVSVGKSYWPLLNGPLERSVPSDKLVVANGSIGGRTSQLGRWLQPESREHPFPLVALGGPCPNGATECSQGCSAAEPLVASHPQRRPEGAEDATTPRTATLLGTTVTLSPADVLAKARQALSESPTAARRFETWHVPLDSDRVAPKWLVSVLFQKPVSRVRSADARRVLFSLGVPCLYASGQ
jgi:hypothetical protein